MGVLVIGAGGHAKVCIELLRAAGEQVCCVLGGDGSPTTFCGVDVVVGDENLPRLRSEGLSRAFIAIGDNSVRARIYENHRSLEFAWVNAISPSAVLSQSASVGQGVAVMAGAVVNADAVLGDLSIINTNASIDHDCEIGYAAHVAPGSALAGCVKVGSKAFLGVGVRVIPNCRIGRECVIGAGAVVVGNIDARSKAVGVPAKVINTYTARN